LSNTPTEPTIGTDLSDDQAAAAFAALEPDDNVDNSNEAPHAEHPEEASRDAQSTEDETPETHTEEHSNEGEQSTESDEDDSGADDIMAKMIPVREGDKTIERPLSEIVANHQRQADITRKAQAIAEDRKSFETQRQAVAQERAQYSTLLGQLNEALNSLKPQEPDWVTLRDQNPQEFLIQRENWRMLNDKQAAIQAELNRVQEQERAQNSQKFLENQRTQLAKVRESIPAWRSDEVAKREIADLDSYLTSVGYTPEEVSMASDPRAMLALYKAMKFDALQKSSKNLKPMKGATLPAGSPQRQQSSKSKQKSSAMSRLRSTGSVNDAAALFSAMDD
jgi:hypothetical protein